MAVKKKKTTKTTKSVSSPKPIKTISQNTAPSEKEYTYKELAELFGISKLKARAYFNMCKLDYDKKLTIKQARELFKKF